MMAPITAQTTTKSLIHLFLSEGKSKLSTPFAKNLRAAGYGPLQVVAHGVVFCQSLHFGSLEDSGENNADNKDNSEL